MKAVYQLFVILLLFCVLGGCVDAPGKSDKQLVVRLAEEPDRLNPILSRGSVATQIENLIFQPLAEIDPVTLEFTPVLIDKIPRLVTENREDLGIVNRMDVRIKKEAIWPNGEPVTYRDILFTLKAVFNPEVGAGRYRTALEFVRGENHDENDEKFISFYLDTAVFNADKSLLNFHILPEYVFDSTGLLSDVKLVELLDENYSEEVAVQLKDFSVQFSSDDLSRTRIKGSGPYELVFWNTGYELKLKRKTDWWGHRFAGSNHFKALPEQIIYRIIPEEQLAITAMANGNIDILTDINPEKFKAMRATASDRYQFFTPEIPRFYYIILNNRSELLNDKKVRRALAHLVDQKKLIDVMMSGFGRPITAPLLPDGPYYDKDIKPYRFDPMYARELLEEAGWTDSDNDGTLDKEIDGNLRELKLRLNITGGEAGRKLALLMKDNAGKAGVEIEIVTQKFSNSMADMRTGNFEMVAASGRQSILEVNLKPSWHSEGFSEGGSNVSGYQSEAMDRILDEMEDEENHDRRLKLYRSFHRQIHEDVPVLFLMMPTERLLVSNGWEVIISPRRPGYFEQLFKRTDNKTVQ